jgi:serine/threonine protein kinase/tetratricopeptide (TPR) repeat protein
MVSMAHWIRASNAPLRMPRKGSFPPVTAFTGNDRFEVRRCLGSGSFGVVYEAYDRTTRTRVALKLPHAASAQGLYLFKQEFRSLADVTHENLATLYELHTEGDCWFFTMELVDGVHLLDHLRNPSGEGGRDSASNHPTGPQPGRGERWVMPDLDRTGGSPRDWATITTPMEAAVLPSPPPDYQRVRSVIWQLAEGLMALHGAGMLHRDLKPSNVLVTSGGRVVILDFGLVTDLESSELGDPLERLAGTPAYMAPEQAAGQPVTSASDWYSVGVLLYQALTGRLPFVGSSRVVLSQKLQHDPLEPYRVVPSTPPDLGELCMGLLRRDPKSRLGGLDILERFEVPTGTRRNHELDVRNRGLSLVGRDSELDILLEGFRLSRGGRTVASLLHGESGTGKSYLARGFLREVAKLDDRAVVLQGRCYEQESVPFKALDSLVDALSQHLKRVSAKEVETVLPRHTRALARLFPVLNQVPSIAEALSEADVPDAQELRRRGFGALRELLRRMALRSPLVLLIDDIHWGDLDSVALLADLLHPPDPPQVMLVLCYRSEEEGPSQVLKELLPRLVESVTILQDVILHPLPAPEARNMARSLLGVMTPEVQELADWIAAESGGSPFFIQELAQHIRHARPEFPSGESQRLETYIQLRVEALPEDARILLRTLAVAGYPLEWEVLHRAAKVDPESIAALTSLRSGRLIRARGGFREKMMETYHDRIRIAVVKGLESLELRDIHRSLAEVLEAGPTPDSQALARHYEEAGDPQKASQHATLAAGQAEAALAFDQAAALYRKALALRSSTDPKAPELWKQLGDALANAGRSGEAAEAYLRATEDVPAEEKNRLQRRAAEEYLRSGQIDIGIRILEEVLATVGAKLPSSRTRTLTSLLWNRLKLRFRGLRFQERASADIPRGVLERVDIHWAVVMGLGPVDALRSADFLTRQLLLALDAGEPFRMVRAFANEVIFQASSGNRSLERTRQVQVRTMELAQRIGHPNPLSRATIASGFAAAMQGQWRKSAELLDRAEATLKQHCTGMDYELHIAQHQSLLNHFVMGHLALLRERLPVVLQEAREKGDRMATTNLRSSLSYILALAQDDPGKALRDLQGALELWTTEGFQIQHYHHLVSALNTEIYDGRFQEAHARLSEAMGPLRRSLLLNVQLMRVTILELKARVALALVPGVGPAARLRLIRGAKADIHSLRAERTPYGIALALKLEAMLSVLQGRKQESLDRLRKAELAFDACDMTLHTMVLRFHRNGGTQKTAEAWMRAQGIHNPVRFAAMHVPITFPRVPSSI